MNAVRITKTKEVQIVLDELKERYKPLSEAEIFKLALSKMYEKKPEKVSINDIYPIGRREFKKYLDKRGIDINTLSEEDVYRIIDSND